MQVLYTLPLAFSGIEPDIYSVDDREANEVRNLQLAMLLFLEQQQTTSSHFRFHFLLHRRAGQVCMQWTRHTLGNGHGRMVN